MDERIGQRLGNYQILRLLGKGGFAEVYLGEHVHLRTQAAIKVLLTRLAGEEEITSFQQEAEIIAHLNHPNIVRVLDFDVFETTPFLVMDYAPGGTLRQRHPKGTQLSPGQILPYVKQVADALHYAHERRLIHRDIKPENLLVGESERILLSDFGIALVSQSSRYQNTQEVVGTAAYMAPEQLQGKPQRASDQYALGIVIYEWLTGSRPFHGNFTELYGQQLFVPPRPLRETLPTLSLRVENVVLTTLEKDPRARFDNIRAFAAAFEAACQEVEHLNSPTIARPPERGYPPPQPPSQPLITPSLLVAPTLPGQPTPPMNTPNLPPITPVPPSNQPPGIISGPSGPARVSGPMPAPGPIPASAHYVPKVAEQPVSRRKALIVGGALVGLAAVGGGIAWAVNTSPKSPNIPIFVQNTATLRSVGPVTINWWHISTTDPLKTTWQDLANQYMQMHSNVTIHITITANDLFKIKLNTAMQSGEPPDIFQSEGGGIMQQYAAAGLMKDITADLQSGGWGDSFGKAGLDLYSYNGKNYGVPWELEGAGFWYNKALFAQAGIPAIPTTWDDFLAVITTLKAKGITPLTLGEKDGWTGAFYWEYLALRLGGKTAFDKAYNHAGGAFTDQPFVQAGQYLQQLVALRPFQNGFLGADYASEAALMGTGQAAIELQGAWAPATDATFATDRKGPDFGFFPFPTVPGGAGAPTDVLGSGNGFGIGKNAPPEAIDFVRFLTNADNQRLLAQKGAALPPVKAAQSAIPDPNLQTVAQLVANATYLQLFYDLFMPTEVGQTVNNETAKLFAGTASPQGVASAIDDAARASGL